MENPLRRLLFLIYVVRMCYFWPGEIPSRQTEYTIGDASRQENELTH